MTRSSAVPVDLEHFGSLLGAWSSGLEVWELRLRRLAPRQATLLQRYRSGLNTLARTTGERARAFIRADAAARLSDLNTRVHRSLLLPPSDAGSDGAAAVSARSLGRRSGRVYLRADARGDGQVVEVLGDLVTATRVVVVVPGMANELSNYPTQLRTKAANLYAELRRRSPAEEVAVVAWLGYDTPDMSVSGLLEAARSDVAKLAARAFTRDLATIRSFNPTAPIIAIGHSYGSVVLGVAMKAGFSGTGVSDVVVVGSPGMDADSRRDLGSPGVVLWASKATVETPVPIPLPAPFGAIRSIVADPVPFAPAHGEDPSAIGFGAHRFSSAGTASHGGYFDPGSVSLRTIAGIASGAIRP